jgi:hypothetical protein
VCQNLQYHVGLASSLPGTEVLCATLLLQLEFKCRFAQIMQTPAAQPKQEL